MIVARNLFPIAADLLLLLSLFNYIFAERIPLIMFQFLYHNLHNKCNKNIIYLF